MDYEYEYEEEARYGRVLWGRIGLLVVGVAVVFLLGRWTAGDAASEDELDALTAERDALQQEVADLEAELEAAQAGGVDAPDDDGADEADDVAESGNDEGDGEGDGESEADSEADDAAGEDDAGEDAETSDAGREHEVQAEETLYTIAEQYYGDGAEFTLIAEANNLSRDDPLRVGQVLEIPPED